MGAINQDNKDTETNIDLKTTIIGAKIFREKLLSRVDTQIIHACSPDINRTKIIHDINTIIKKICSHFNINHKCLMHTKRGQHNWPKQALIARCEMVVATRLHACILGLVFSKKVLPIAYDYKILNLLKDLDFKGSIIDIRKIQAFDLTSFDAQQLSINTITHQKQLAEQQFQELDKILVKNTKVEFG